MEVGLVTKILAKLLDILIVNWLDAHVLFKISNVALDKSKKYFKLKEISKESMWQLLYDQGSA